MKRKIHYSGKAYAMNPAAALCYSVWPNLDVSDDLDAVNCLRCLRYMEKRPIIRKGSKFLIGEPINIMLPEKRMMQFRISQSGLKKTLVEGDSFPSVTSHYIWVAHVNLFEAVKMFISTRETSIKAGWVPAEEMELTILSDPPPDNPILKFLCEFVVPPYIRGKLG